MTQTDYFARAILFAWAIAFARWPIFKIVSFHEYLAFFRAVFCTEQLLNSCRMVFCMFLAFLIFDPNWPSCKGYCLCKMVTLGQKLKMPKSCKKPSYKIIRVVLCKKPLEKTKLSHFSNIWCFFERFSAQNNFYNLVRWFFACFWHF